MYRTLLILQVLSKKMAVFFAAMIALSAFLYGAFLLTAVERTAVRSELEGEIATLTSELGTYQTHYLAAVQKITPEYAAELGFVTPGPSSIAYINTSARALSLHNGLSRQ